jgi:hypothetical protein
MTGEPDAGDGDAAGEAAAVAVGEARGHFAARLPLLRSCRASALLGGADLKVCSYEVHP